MKRWFCVAVLALALAACAQPTPEPLEPTALPAQSEAAQEEPMKQETTLTLSVNGTPLDVSWEQNATVDELRAYAQNETIRVETERFGGFEQVGALPQAFTSSDVQLTTAPGDLVLYSDDQIVLFFGSNTWSYTRLGHIEGLSEQELADLLGGETAVVELQG